MSEGIPYADIVIIALIAGFILLRLRSVLGDKTGHDNPQFFMKQQNKAQENKEKIIPLHDKPITIKPKKEEDAYLEGLEDKELAQSLKDVQAKDLSFHASQFLDGAKMAFEMVFDAFTKADHDTLNMLLAEPIYKEFKEAIEKREEDENTTETTLVAVSSKEIQAAKLSGKMARITVKFISEQITLVRNPEGEIVEGDASQIEHVENEWVFERDVTSKNPNWKIIET